MMLFLSYVRGDSPEFRKKLKYMITSRSYDDITLARNVLDYGPIVSYEEGMRQGVEWWVKKRSKLPKEKAQTSDMTTGPPSPYSLPEAFRRRVLSSDPCVTSCFKN
ncbi:hypothetical protein B0H10DRAFT_1328391 [Mycena sp. CBHHK59/15]|nr:hypothetical protein B0H10DRAFT_338697 [Mycena sp. CBHHK59/15]KAJ6617288.1 hypothetical protein B0H10DRAFT_1328391 [Mycena sp. CBHHK59/15]